MRAGIVIGNGGLAERWGPDDSGPSPGSASGHQDVTWKTAAAWLLRLLLKAREGRLIQGMSGKFYERFSAPDVP
jgi:hypothetical protein